MFDIGIFNMANTYTQIYIHIVFTVQGRMNLITNENRDELQKFITGVVQKRGQKMLSVFSMPDHTHLLIGLNTSISISDLVRDVKSASSKFINEKKWIVGKFNWQEGFGAFSYSRSQIDNVIKYISNQEKHHKIKTFKEEYIELLKLFEIEYNEKYLFDWIV